MKKNTLQFRYILPIIILFFFAIYLSMSVANHYLLKTFCFDYGFFNYNFYHFAHFNYPNEILYAPPLRGFFSNHLAFIFIISSLFYWPFAWLFNTYTLLIFQSVVITVGGYYVYKLIMYKSKSFWLSIILMFHYFILLGHFSAIAGDYLDTTIGASLIPVFLYYLEKRKFIVSTIFFILILVAKENMALWLISISGTVVLANLTDKKKVYINLGYILVAATYFIIAFKVIIPYLEDPYYGYYGFSFSNLGKTPAEAIKFIAQHPLETLKLSVSNTTGIKDYDGIKQEFYWFFLISGGILLIRNPIWLLPFLPIIAQKVLNDEYVRWGLISFYTIEIVSLLSIAIYYSLEKISNKKIKIILALTITLSTSVLSIVKLNTRVAKYYMPEKEKFYDFKVMFSTEYPIKKVHKYIRTIPNDIPVSTVERLVPHLAFRDKIYLFPNIADAELVILLKDHSTYPLNKEEFENKITELRDNPDFRVLKDDYPLLVFQKINQSAN